MRWPLITFFQCTFSGSSRSFLFISAENHISQDYTQLVPFRATDHNFVKQDLSKYSKKLIDLQNLQLFSPAGTKTDDSSSRRVKRVFSILFLNANGKTVFKIAPNHSEPFQNLYRYQNALNNICYKTRVQQLLLYSFIASCARSGVSSESKPSSRRLLIF